MLQFFIIHNHQKQIAVVPTSYSLEIIKQIDSFFVKMENNFDAVATESGSIALFPPG